MRASSAGKCSCDARRSQLLPGSRIPAAEGRGPRNIQALLRRGRVLRVALVSQHIPLRSRRGPRVCSTWSAAMRALCQVRARLREERSEKRSRIPDHLCLTAKPAVHCAYGRGRALLCPSKAIHSRSAEATSPLFPQNFAPQTAKPLSELLRNISTRLGRIVRRCEYPHTPSNSRFASFYSCRRTSVKARQVRENGLHVRKSESGQVKQAGFQDVPVWASLRRSRPPRRRFESDMPSSSSA